MQQPSGKMPAPSSMQDDSRFRCGSGGTKRSSSLPDFRQNGPMPHNKNAYRLYFIIENRYSTFKNICAILNTAGEGPQDDQNEVLGKTDPSHRTPSGPGYMKNGGF